MGAIGVPIQLKDAATTRDPGESDVFTWLSDPAAREWKFEGRQDRNLSDLKPGDRIAAPRRLQIAEGESWPRHEIIALAGLLARRMCRTKQAIYRVVLDERIERLTKRKVRFIDDPLYHQPDAESMVNAIASAEQLPAILPCPTRPA